MAKRFRLRISRAISTTLQSCRSKHPSILPEDPVPSLSALKINGQNVHSRPSFNPRASFAAAVAAAGGDERKLPEFKWRKEEKWHVFARIYDKPAPRWNVTDSPEQTPAPPPSSDERKKRRGKRSKKKINVPSRLRLSTSSADSGWFSSEAGCCRGGGGGGAAADERHEDETETLVSSSLSFSTDSSSDLNPQLHPIKETQPFAGNSTRRRTKKRISKRAARAASNPPSTADAEAEAPTRLSVFKKLIPCTVEGKVKESYAIVKRSADPYEDFKNSMVDMILEKQMFDPADLEQLLQCFLSLNSRHYHGIIVEAFSEIWEAIFAPSGCSKDSDDARNRRRVSKAASF